jgi:hypothetical protein
MTSQSRENQMDDMFEEKCQKKISELHNCSITKRVSETYGRLQNVP